MPTVSEMKGSNETDKNTGEVFLMRSKNASQESHCNDANANSSSDDETDEDVICGLGSFRPQWMQRWATSRTFLILFSFLGVLQGSYYTYLVGVMTTLEKRFDFESKIGGTIMMADEIAPLVFGIMVGYFGGKSHRPRVIACGMILTAVCCFVSALPYFIYGAARHSVFHGTTNGTSLDVCEESRDTDVCDKSDKSPTVTALACFMIGSFVTGFGSLAYYTVGITYMDDITKKSSMPIYFAITISFRLFGPTFGYFMSSAFLNLYENPYENPGYDNSDPRWIGAWWIGFVLQGFLLCIFSFPILFFPRRPPGKRKIHAKINPIGADRKKLKDEMIGLIESLRRLAVNPLYFSHLLGDICGATAGVAVITYMPKYMENQFHMPASTANLLSGPPALISIMVFTMIGGVLIWKFKPSAKVLAIIIFLTGFSDCFSYASLMIPGCDQMTMTGSAIANGMVILENSCNSPCKCPADEFIPVCGPDGTSTYFSPCFAGCTGVNASEPEKFFNCSCTIDSSGNYTFSSYVTKGYCHDSNCFPQAILYMAIMAISTAITSLSRVAFPLMLFRSVDPIDKSVAIGTFKALLCGLALIPFPIIFGSFADSSCILWESKCGETGNCWLYDVNIFNYKVHGVSSVYAAGSAIFFFGIVFYSGRVRNLYEEEEISF